MVQPRGQGWITLGTGHRYQIIPESIKFTGDKSEYGCLSATWSMFMDPRFQHYDLEQYTPVVIQDGITPIWSGRIIATPTQWGESGIVNVEAQGWGQHLKDDCMDKIFCLTDLSKFNDGRQLLGTTLGQANYYAAAQVSSDNGIYLGHPANVPFTSTGFGGVVFDAGPNNVVVRTIINYTSSNNQATVILLAKTTALENVFDTTIGSTSVANNAGASGTLRFTSSGASRYLNIGLYHNTVVTTPVVDVYFRITSILVTTGTSYESGDTSALTASLGITRVLDTICPNISSDRTKITTTSFLIPEFYT